MSDVGTQAAVNQETLGAQGEPCRECGSPLAADQRYCLNCGARRTDARIDYRRYIQQSGSDATGTEGSNAPPPPSGGEPTKQQRDYTPLAAVGGIAVLGVMLLIGVLIGKGGNNDNASTPPPVVVNGASEESGATSESGGGSGQTKPNNQSAGGGPGKSKGASNKSGGSHPVEASSNSLSELESESGKNYVEESKKIPDEVVTPGKPPPINKSKPPGGAGEQAETIE
jgi:hypothetical protein